MDDKRKSPAAKGEAKGKNNKENKANSDSYQEQINKPIDTLPPQSRQETANLTDLGNARRLVRAFSPNVRYGILRKAWLLWGQHRWVEAKRLEEFEMAKKVPNLIREEAWTRSPVNRPDPTFMNWAEKTEDVARLSALVRLARSEPGVPVLESELDSDTLLLGVKNGVLDLRTGEFRDARRDDLITKQAGCEFDENAKCHEWEKFISEISRGDIEQAAYLRRMVGYCLTGGTAEQCFFVLHGSGANGKSVFLNILEALLGDYAKRTPPETLLSQRATGGARPDLARLAGVRAALAAESGATALLDEPVVKQLTGQDTVTARYLYSDLFEFKPQFKLILATNYVPEIRGTDEGIWRRIHLVPFNAYFTPEKQNRNLERELKAELPGILNWALDGLRDYRELEGLKPPPCVQRATEAYRSEMDQIADWFDERCLLDPHSSEAVGELYVDYVYWCRSNNWTVVSKPRLSAELVRRGFNKIRDSKARAFAGIRLNR